MYLCFLSVRTCSPSVYFLNCLHNGTELQLIITSVGIPIHINNHLLSLHETCFIGLCNDIKTLNVIK